MNVGIGTEAAQFLFWEYIYGIFVSVGKIVRVLRLRVFLYDIYITNQFQRGRGK
jgi:hypothetical protein